MLQASDRFSDRFLRLGDVCDLTGLKRSSLYEMMEDGEFCRPYKLSERAVGWRESEVIAWMNSRSVVEPERKTKLCASCGEVKAVAKYHPHATTPDRLHPYCKSCIRAGKKRLRASRAEAASA